MTVSFVAKSQRRLENFIYCNKQGRANFGKKKVKNEKSFHMKKIELKIQYNTIQLK